MNTHFRTRSLPLQFEQAFLFKKGTHPHHGGAPQEFNPIADPTGNNFIPLKRLHGTLPAQLTPHLQHISTLVNYEHRFDCPDPGVLPLNNVSWQHLHDLGVIALVDSTMQRMIRVLHHYAAITRRPFFDFSKVKSHYSTCNYKVNTHHGKILTISDVLLTILTTPQAITFFRRTTDVSTDELTALQYILSHKEPLLLDGTPLDIVKRPIFMRYIHVKERIEKTGKIWKQNMNAILYF